MSSFLARMAAASAVRAASARARLDERALAERVARLPAPVAPDLVRPGFDLIAEVKRRAPSAGALSAGRTDGPALAIELATRYATAGAAVISVLTEPDAFDGSLDDLSEVAASVDRPAMRKDFLVDPYQLLEARANGASGALLIMQLVDDERMKAMLDVAASCGLFVLLEAFDAADLDRAGQTAEAASRCGVEAWIGLNARDLTTLEIDPARFERLASSFPADVPRIAESGVVDADGAARVARLGYRALLCGSALMRADDPGVTAAAMIAAGRDARGGTACA